MGKMVGNDDKMGTHFQNGGNGVNMGKTRNGVCLVMDFIEIRGIIARGSVVNGGCGIISAEWRGQ